MCIKCATRTNVRFRRSSKRLYFNHRCRHVGSTFSTTSILFDSDERSDVERTTVSICNDSSRHKRFVIITSEDRVESLLPIGLFKCRSPRFFSTTKRTGNNQCDGSWSQWLSSTSNRPFVGK